MAERGEDGQKWRGMTIDLGEHSRPTVATIARVAGVSVSAVSSVLNNRQRERRIAGETVEKIREAAARLGYLPNVNARRLRGDTATRAAIVLALVTSYEAPIPLVNHFIAALRNLAAGGKEGAKRTGPTSVSVEMFSAGKLRELPGLLSGDHFNAALILNTTPGDDAFLQSVTLPYPVVLVNRSIAGYSAVFEDESAGARAAAILASAGRRKLAVLHGLPLTQMTETRLRNFRREARQLTGKPAQAILTDGLSEEGGYRAMRDFLGSGGRIDGIYAVSDAFALGGGGVEGGGLRHSGRCGGGRGGRLRGGAVFRSAADIGGGLASGPGGAGERGVVRADRVGGRGAALGADAGGGDPSRIDRGTRWRSGGAEA